MKDLMDAIRDIILFQPYHRQGKAALVISAIISAGTWLCLILLLVILFFGIPSFIKPHP